MKGFIYLSIFLILVLLIENILKKWNVIEGLDCAPKQNSLSYKNQATAKSQENQIEILKKQIQQMKPRIDLNHNKVNEHKAKIEKAIKSIQAKTNAKQKELDKAGNFKK
jgi:gas vesicle protein